MAMPAPPAPPEGGGGQPSEEEVINMLQQILGRALELAGQFGIDLVAMIQEMQGGGEQTAPPPMPPTM